MAMRAVEILHESIAPLTRVTHLPYREPKSPVPNQSKEAFMGFLSAEELKRLLPAETFAYPSPITDSIGIQR